MNLIPKQENAVYFLKDSQTKELVYGGAAGGGKSALGVLWLIEQCQIYPGTRWLMGRSKLKALKETTLNTFFELTTKLKISTQFNYNAQSGIIYWKNGSEILLKDLYLYPADPNFDSLGSLEITGAFIDECNQITYKAWQIVKSRVRYKIKELGITPKILGTCNPSKNWVYSQFYLKDKNKTIDNDKKFIQALPKDNPHLPQSYLESLLSLDDNSKQRLYYGNWEYDNDPAKLIDFEKIQNIFTNDFLPYGEAFISADIARFGSDKMVICVWKGFRVVEIYTLAKSSITEVANAIRDLASKHSVPLSNIVADEDGVGGGVVDILGCKGFVNNSKAMPVEGVDVQYQNLKTQCYFKLAELIQDDKVFVNCTDGSIIDDITKELEQVKRDKIDNDGKLRILPKEKVKELIGRSPDYSDALMMRMYFCFKQSFFFF
jgi:phage terminase large subunit